MVRTRADNTARKAVAAKAPRKVLAPSSTSTSVAASGIGSPAGKYAGGNAYCPRPTPDWQKGMSQFIVKKPRVTEKENAEPTNTEIGESSSSAKLSDDSSQKDMPATSPEKESQTSTDAAACSSSASSSKNTKRNGIIDSDSDGE